MTLTLEEASRALLNLMLERNGLEAEALKAARALVEGVIQADIEREIAVLRAAEGLPQAWTARTATCVPQWTTKRGGPMLSLGQTVKVRGLGKRNGTTGVRTDSAGWKVTGIAQRGDDVNVVVLKNGTEHTVRLDRIV